MESPPPPAPSGTSFYERARAKHQRLFAGHLARQAKFATLEAYTAALQRADWQMIDSLIHRSFRMGVEVGLKSPPEDADWG